MKTKRKNRMKKTGRKLIALLLVLQQLAGTEGSSFLGQINAYADEQATMDQAETKRSDTKELYCVSDTSGCGYLQGVVYYARKGIFGTDYLPAKYASVYLLDNNHCRMKDKAGKDIQTYTNGEGKYSLCLTNDPADEYEKTFYVVTEKEGFYSTESKVHYMNRADFKVQFQKKVENEMIPAAELIRKYSSEDFAKYCLKLMKQLIPEAFANGKIKETEVLYGAARMHEGAGKLINIKWPSFWNKIAVDSTVQTVEQVLNKLWEDTPARVRAEIMLLGTCMAAGDISRNCGTEVFQEMMDEAIDEIPEGSVWEDKEYWEFNLKFGELIAELAVFELAGEAVMARVARWLEAGEKTYRIAVSEAGQFVRITGEGVFRVGESLVLDVDMAEGLIRSIKYCGGEVTDSVKSVTVMTLNRSELLKYLIRIEDSGNGIRYYSATEELISGVGGTAGAITGGVNEITSRVRMITGNNLLRLTLEEEGSFDGCFILSELAGQAVQTAADDLMENEILLTGVSEAVKKYPAVDVQGDGSEGTITEIKEALLTNIGERKKINEDRIEELEKAIAAEGRDAKMPEPEKLYRFGTKSGYSGEEVITVEECEDPYEGIILTEAEAGRIRAYINQLSATETGRKITALLARTFTKNYTDLEKLKRALLECLDKNYEAAEKLLRDRERLLERIRIVQPRTVPEELKIKLETAVQNYEMPKVKGAIGAYFHGEYADTLSFEKVKDMVTAGEDAFAYVTGGEEVSKTEEEAIRDALADLPGYIARHEAGHLFYDARYATEVDFNGESDCYACVNFNTPWLIVYDKGNIPEKPIDSVWRASTEIGAPALTYVKYGISFTGDINDFRKGIEEISEEVDYLIGPLASELVGPVTRCIVAEIWKTMTEQYAGFITKGTKGNDPADKIAEIWMEDQVNGRYTDIKGSIARSGFRSYNSKKIELLEMMQKVMLNDQGKMAVTWKEKQELSRLEARLAQINQSLEDYKDYKECRAFIESWAGCKGYGYEISALKKSTEGLEKTESAVKAINDANVQKIAEGMAEILKSGYSAYDAACAIGMAELYRYREAEKLQEKNETELMCMTADTAALTGWVVDSETKEPVETAKVAAYYTGEEVRMGNNQGEKVPDEKLCVSEGQIKLSNISEGGYCLYIEAEGYNNKQHGLVLQKNRETNIGTIELVRIRQTETEKGKDNPEEIISGSGKDGVQYGSNGGSTGGGGGGGRTTTTTEERNDRETDGTGNDGTGTDGTDETETGTLSKISGKILDENGKGLSEVNITIYKEKEETPYARRTSKKDGSYEASLARNCYTLVYEKKTYEEVKEKVTLGKADITRNVMLKKKEGNLILNVSDRDSGKAVMDAELILKEEEQDEEIRLKTDRNGRCEEKLKYGKYTGELKAAGYETEKVIVTMGEETVKISKELERLKKGIRTYVFREYYIDEGDSDSVATNSTTASKGISEQEKEREAEIRAQWGVEEDENIHTVPDPEIEVFKDGVSLGKKHYSAGGTEENGEAEILLNLEDGEYELETEGKRVRMTSPCREAIVVRGEDSGLNSEICGTIIIASQKGVDGSCFETRPQIRVNLYHEGEKIDSTEMDYENSSIINRQNKGSEGNTYSFRGLNEREYEVELEINGSTAERKTVRLVAGKDKITVDFEETVKASEISLWGYDEKGNKAGKEALKKVVLMARSSAMVHVSCEGYEDTDVLVTGREEDYEESVILTPVELRVSIGLHYYSIKTKDRKVAGKEAEEDAEIRYELYDGEDAVMSGTAMRDEDIRGTVPYRPGGYKLIITSEVYADVIAFPMPSNYERVETEIGLTEGTGQVVTKTGKNSVTNEILYDRRTGERCIYQNVRDSEKNEKISGIRMTEGMQELSLIRIYSKKTEGKTQHRYLREDLRINVEEGKTIDLEVPSKKTCTEDAEKALQEGYVYWGDLTEYTSFSEIEEAMQPETEGRLGAGILTESIEMNRKENVEKEETVVVSLAEETKEEKTEKTGEETASAEGGQDADEKSEDPVAAENVTIRIDRTDNSDSTDWADYADTERGTGSVSGIPQIESLKIAG